MLCSQFLCPLKSKSVLSYLEFLCYLNLEFLCPQKSKSCALEFLCPLKSKSVFYDLEFLCYLNLVLTNLEFLCPLKSKSCVIKSSNLVPTNLEFLYYLNLVFTNFDFCPLNSKSCGWRIVLVKSWLSFVIYCAIGRISV